MRRFKPGEAVYARARDGQIGTFAERISVKEGDLALKPADLVMAEAASIPLVGLTAWQVLVERTQIRPGQKVLIHAGSGGVGTFAIQLAKHLGATVATTASAANTNMVKRLGADSRRAVRASTCKSGKCGAISRCDGPLKSKQWRKWSRVQPDAYGVMGWTPPGGIDVPKWRCEHTT